MSVDDLGATLPDRDGVPQGYARASVVVARLIDRASQAQIPYDQESLKRFRRSLEPGARRAPSGVFAELASTRRCLRCVERPGLRKRNHPR